MTKKHFVALAAALKNERPQPGWDPNKLTMWNACVNAVANEMWAFNTRFDRGRFIAACGGLFEIGE